MNNEKTLKNLNRKWLISYLIIGIIIFALFNSLIELKFKDVNELYKTLISPKGIFSILSYPLIIILEGFISSNIKAIFVFWRFKNPLPGCRAFTDIGQKDPRIDVNKMNLIFKNGFFNDPIKQNNLWYSLFRKHDDNNVIKESHRSFLLTRDLTTITILFIPLSLFLHTILKTEITMMMINVSILATMYIILAIVSQNYGKRLVANVIVESIKQKIEV